MRSRTIFLVGGKYIFWVFFLVAYLAVFVAGYAHETFGVGSADAEFVRAQCEATRTCGDNHDAFELAQMTLMRVMAGEIWVTGIILLALETTFLVIATRRRVSARTAIRWWKVQLVVVVASLAIYLALLLIGARGLRRIPENARLLPFADTFSAPFADQAMISYIVVFVVVSAIALVHNRAMAGLLPST
ncbi:hypothetical protein ACTMTJ_39800 [Phytohabitans sp. LJ34]|uniref:hypothetical protein n=1 Tax=Phytohabitans sp. LJ34 TaxID=3452217 RepID=UPI003F897C29